MSESSFIFSDYLIKEPKAFESALLTRIKLGSEVIDLISPRDNDEFEVDQAEARRWDDYNIELLKVSFSGVESTYREQYEKSSYSINHLPKELSVQDKAIMLRKAVAYRIENLKSLVDRIELLRVQPSEKLKTASKPATKVSENKIFIVHGHNAAAKEQVARTIDKLGLYPVILSEQANQGKTLIEKFEQHSDVGYSLVLLTADDEGKSIKESTPKKRARQNAILELGYFIGKLGRSKVAIIYEAGVEVPNDIDGVAYIPLDAHWQIAVAKELKHAGYQVDANALL